MQGVILFLVFLIYFFFSDGLTSFKESMYGISTEIRQRMINVKESTMMDADEEDDSDEEEERISMSYYD
jgi:hypothetical protein